MPHSSRSRRSRLARLLMGGVAALLASAALVVVPSSPAAAIQAISWTAAPPSTAVVGQPVSFAWSGTANTFLGARITGCFAHFPDGASYVNNFQGNFTTGNCNYMNRAVTTVPSYPVTVGFMLSTGSQMTMSWNIDVQSPTPTVTTSGNVVTTATSVQGAPATFSASGSDGSYGTYGATCTPASGSTFPPGTTTVSCSATNPAGRTGTSSLSVTVNKATPLIAWTPPASVVAGRPLGSALDATVTPSNVPGSLVYTDANGTPLTSASVLSPGALTVFATFTPSGAGTNAYHPAQTSRTLTVVRLPQAVTFGTVPSYASVDDAPFEVTASGTSGGGAVTISAAAGSACTVVDHGAGAAGAATVTVSRDGACVLQARQAQTASHAASPVVQWSFTVARRTPVITWDPGASITYGATLADALDATANVVGTWTYRLDGVVVDGSTVPGSGEGRVLQVVFTPADPDRYTTATASRTLDVLRAPQQLAVSPVADRAYGQAPFDVDVTDEGPGAVSVDVTGPCSVAGRTVTPSAAGDCEVTVTKAGDTNHLPASVVRTVNVAKGQPILDWQRPETLSYGDALGAEELDATVSAEIDGSAAAPVGEVTYTLPDGAPAEGVVLQPGDHVLHARWTPTGASVERWHPVTGTVAVTVRAALPTLAWSAPADIVYGTPLGDAQLSAVARPTGATGDVTYFLADGVTPARGAVLKAGRDQALVARYQPDAAANGRFLPVWRTVAIDVAKAPLTVRAPSAARRYGAADPVLAPTYSGFVNGDTAAALNTPATCASSADAASPAGTYAVTCDGATSPDYAVRSTQGHLRVRYGLRGLAWALGGRDHHGRAVVDRGSRTPIRIHLRDSEERSLPQPVMAAIGRECAATLAVAGADPTCFRYDRRARRLVAVLDARGLPRASTVPVVVEVRAADASLARRRTIQLRVR